MQQRRFQSFSWRSLLKSRAILFVAGFVVAIAFTISATKFLTNSPPKPFINELLPSEAIAQIVEIRERPVWIKFLNSPSETSATVGNTIAPGETIHTEANALVQIALKSGMVIRIEGDSTLTFNPQNQINLVKGRILAWIPGGKDITAQIQTPKAIASMTDSTVYIEIPKLAQQSAHIFPLQGEVEVRLDQAQTPVMLKKGQDLEIPARGKPAKPKLLAQAAIEDRFSKSKLLYGFSGKLETLVAIEADFQISAARLERIQNQKLKNIKADPAATPADSPIYAPKDSPRESSYQPNYGRNYRRDSDRDRSNNPPQSLPQPRPSEPVPQTNLAPPSPGVNEPALPPTIAEPVRNDPPSSPPEPEPATKGNPEPTP